MNNKQSVCRGWTAQIKRGKIGCPSRESHRFENEGWVDECVCLATLKGGVFVLAKGACIMLKEGVKVDVGIRINWNESVRLFVGTIWNVFIFCFN